jgi:hypothetical protein
MNDGAGIGNRTPHLPSFGVCRANSVLNTNLVSGDVRTEVEINGRVDRPHRFRKNGWTVTTLPSVNYVTGDPNGIRTRVTAVKGRCPRPLDDRVLKWTVMVAPSGNGASGKCHSRLRLE